MKNRKAWLAAAAAFFALQLLGAALALWLRPSGGDLALLIGGLVLLGSAAGGLLFLLLRQRQAAPEVLALEDDVEAAVRTARARLASARRGNGGKLGKLPMLLVLGPSGSTKTTAIVESGLDPDLLAGEVHRNDMVVPTGAINLWYTQDLVVAEAGGPVLDDPGAWNRLIRHLRPSRWSAALTRRAQASRVALVCFPSDALLQPGASQSVPAAARALRTRLVELSHQLGVRLPVYVMFTKADRVPAFEEFVRNLSRDEAQEVLGATLPVEDDAAPGVYAERASRRIAAAFGGLFRSLAVRRGDVLARESREPTRAAAYEFPREIRKLSDLATQFLVELCRPSQLSVSPFLRGFYFTGVRPVIVSEAAADLLPRAAPQVALGATSVFSLQQVKAEPRPEPPSGSRRIPEWVFLRRVFRDVVLRDEVAHGITGSGLRVDVVRRALLTAAIAAGLLLSVALTVSYVNNRAVHRDALAAAQAVQRLDPLEGGAPTLAALHDLDVLREQTAQVAALDRAGPPWRMRWGLYTGGRLLPRLRGLYFDRFDRLLWSNSRESLLAALAAPEPAADGAAEYGITYNRLKAHLITTSYPEHSTSEFLVPVLLDHWRPAAEVDPERLEVARRNFEFFAAELPHGNPYRDPPRDALVTEARLALARLDDELPLYRVLVADAGQVADPVQFDRAFPAARGVVSNAYVVPGAFTAEGWATVQRSLSDLDRLFAQEAWVVGERTRTPAERAELAERLRRRYTDAYISHWQSYLDSARVVTGGRLEQIADRLEAQSSNQPPLMQLFALASRHTAVDTAEVARAFQPLHRVVPPDLSDRFIGETNSGYVQALGMLRDALVQALAADRAEPDAAALEQVNGAIRTIASDFTPQGPAGATGTRVRRLMEAPTTGIQAALGARPAQAINEMGREFCAEFGRVLAKYPFNAGGAPATADELTQMFQPGSSVLWTFLDGPLSELLAPRGNQFGPRLGATPRPTAGFVDFVNGAVAVSRAMFDAGGSGPEVAFMFRPQTTNEMPEIVVSMDGQTQTFTRTDAAAKPLTWRGERASGITIVGRADGVELFRLDQPGTWGVFRLFADATWSGTEGSRHTVQWRVPGRADPLIADITFARGVPVFHPQRVRMRCVPTVATG